ncbi:MAG: NAD(P)/FAD-dependent oxidoreductase [Spirochaetaceae bacterium]
MHDLLILGAGPAGLAAASYAFRKHLDVQLVARDLGGKTNLRVEFPGTQAHQVLRAHELVHGFKNTVEYLSHAHTIASAKSVTAHDGRVDLTVTGETGASRTLSARCLIVATGARPRPLRVPGETELFGRGLGYSSISYSHILAERRVFLVGDSQRTVDDARELAWQAREVVLLLHHAGRYESLYREQLAELDNVTLIEGMRVSEFRGGDYCEAVVLTDSEDSEEIVEADAFFVQLQPEPQSALVADIVETDPEGRIVVDMRNRTTRPGIFAAGDVTNVGFEQILIALGEGSKAALSAYQYLMHRR